MSSFISNERPAPDQVLTDIADYALNYEIQGDLAYSTAQHCLREEINTEGLEQVACIVLAQLRARLECFPKEGGRRV